MTRLIARLAALALLTSLSVAHADTWRVDVIVFGDRHYDLSGDVEARLLPEPADPTRTIPLEDHGRLAANGIRVLSEGDSILGQQWSRLRNSQRFEPILRVAWTQKDPPRSGGPVLLLRHGPVMATEMGPISQLEGTFRLTLRRFLHLDVDLQWTEDDGFGFSHSTSRLREQRRMRSETLHHLDSPRLGVLAHIQRVGD